MSGYENTFTTCSISNPRLVLQRFQPQTAPSECRSSLLWANPHIVPATNAGFVHTAFEPVWLQGGDVKSSAGAGKRGANASPCSFQPSTPASDGYRLGRDQRLRANSDIASVRRNGRKLQTQNLEIRVAPASRPRVGVIVPKHGQTAVSRNKLQRRIREILRLHLLPGMEQVDVLIRCRQSAYALSFDELKKEIRAISSFVGRISRA